MNYWRHCSRKAHTHARRKMWHVILYSYPSLQKCFTVVINEEKGPGFCLSLQQPSVSHQPQTYLHTKESSKLRNVVLIPWASKKVRLCILIGVQGSISWSVRGGVLIRTCWPSLQALRSWHPQKPCMWCWPSHESELKQHAEECPHTHTSQLQGGAPKQDIRQNTN